MAQPPVKTPHMKPPDGPPKAPPPPAPAEQVNIHGRPPTPNMAIEDEDEHARVGISDSTRAEMMAGLEALDKLDDKLNAEMLAGRKALERHRK